MSNQIWTCSFANDTEKKKKREREKQRKETIENNQ